MVMNMGGNMNKENLRKEIISEIEKKYRINSYRKVVESIVDISINKCRKPQ